MGGVARDISYYSVYWLQYTIFKHFNISRLKQPPENVFLWQSFEIQIIIFSVSLALAPIKLDLISSWDQGYYYTQEKSQKDRILTASKTIWMLMSWHKTLVPAFGSQLIMTELKKVGSMGSTLPEHLRFFPETHKGRYYIKDVWSMYLYSVKPYFLCIQVYLFFPSNVLSNVT